MVCDKFVQEVVEHFHYLARDYHFELVAHDSSASVAGCRVELQSRSCRIVLVLERDDVFLWLGSLSSEMTFDLGIVIAFLTPNSTESEWLEYVPLPDRDIAPDLRVHMQIRQLAAKLRLYMDRITQECRKDTFLQNRSVLEAMMWKRHREIMRRMDERKGFT